MPEYTPSDMAKMMQEALDHYEEWLKETGGSGGERISVDIFTCYECIHAYKCEHAFDMYNTNGDCLASK